MTICRVSSISSTRQVYIGNEMPAACHQSFAVEDCHCTGGDSDTIDSRSHLTPRDELGLPLEAKLTWWPGHWRNCRVPTSGKFDTFIFCLPSTKSHTYSVDSYTHVISHKRSLCLVDRLRNSLQALSRRRARSRARVGIFIGHISYTACTCLHRKPSFA